MKLKSNNMQLGAFCADYQWEILAQMFIFIFM